MKTITIADVRKWLEINKIFFEIFSMIIIGISVSIIAYMTYKVSKDSFDYQIKTDFPAIHIGSEPDFDDEAGRSDRISFYNAGKELFDPSITDRTFVSFYSFKLDKSICFGLHDYYDSVKYTKENKGVIAEIYREKRGNFEDVWKLDPESIIEKTIYDNVNIVTYLTISYFSPNTKTKTDYFRFSNGSADRSRKISVKEYMSTIKRINNECMFPPKGVISLTHKEISEYFKQ